MKSPIEVFLVFDLETTGLDGSKHAIVEIACCPFDIYLNNLKEYESGIIKPDEGKIITDGALNANGISREQLAKGRDSKEVINELVAYLKKLSSRSSKIILVGHNIDRFDIPFLDTFFTEHKKDLSKYVNDKFTIDTMWWGRTAFEESPNFKLGTVCMNVGVELINAHRAVNDTRANRDMVKVFIQRMRTDSKANEEVKEKRFRDTFEF